MLLFPKEAMLLPGICWWSWMGFQLPWGSFPSFPWLNHSTIQYILKVQIQRHHLQLLSVKKKKKKSKISQIKPIRAYIKQGLFILDTAQFQHETALDSREMMDN